VILDKLYEEISSFVDEEQFSKLYDYAAKSLILSISCSRHTRHNY
jgi:hypothetical protein